MKRSEPLVNKNSVAKRRQISARGERSEPLVIASKHADPERVSESACQPSINLSGWAAQTKKHQGFSRGGGWITPGLDSCVASRSLFPFRSERLFDCFRGGVRRCPTRGQRCCLIVKNATGIGTKQLIHRDSDPVRLLCFFS
jgi:hypothetical protein